MNQAFIFDVFGTLLDWRTGVATQLKHAFEMRSLSIDPLAFSDYWRALYGPAMDRVRSGSRGYVRPDGRRKNEMKDRQRCQSEAEARLSVGSAIAVPAITISLKKQPLDCQAASTRIAIAQTMLKAINILT